MAIALSTIMHLDGKCNDRVLFLFFEGINNFLEANYLIDYMLMKLTHNKTIDYSGSVWVDISTVSVANKWHVHLQLTGEVSKLSA